MADDAELLLKKRPGLAVSMLQDGAPDLWNLLSIHRSCEGDLPVRAYAS